MPSPADELEWRTRRERIDPQLRAAGWDIVRFNENRPELPTGTVAITEYPTANGPADYALVVDQQIVGVMEAKKVSLGPAGVLIQAERYARGLPDGRFNFRGLRAPFLYSTNGEVI